MSRKRKAAAKPVFSPLPEQWQHSTGVAVDIPADDPGVPREPEPAWQPPRSSESSERQARLAAALDRAVDKWECRSREEPAQPGERESMAFKGRAEHVHPEPVALSSLVEPMALLPYQRETFIDRAAIARFGSGYPARHCYVEAEKLWAERERWLESKGAK